VHTILDYGDLNTVYIAASGGRGAGVFSEADPQLVLTSSHDKNRKRSV
jgi:hypothetical protein